jgi:hypothetical protein
MDPLKAFQPMCSELLAEEPGIATCEIYGVSGQSQRGIDLLAKGLDGAPYAVGQCKCYATFSPAQIVKASEEFFPHLEYWKSHGICRFVLFVACDLSTTQQQEEILRQQRRFQTHGIHYEAWSGHILRQRLAGHMEIVSRHIHSPEVMKNICGQLVTEVVFTETTTEGLLRQLQAALREPAKYHSDIEDLLFEEAQRLANVMASPTPEYPFVVNELAPSFCAGYLEYLKCSSERFTRLVAAVVRRDRDEMFVESVARAVGILAQDPARLVTSYTPGIPEVRLYPLALAIYTLFILGAERRALRLLHQVARQPFLSQRSPHFEKLTLIEALDLMVNAQNQFEFFRLVKENSFAPFAETVMEAVLPWLREYLTNQEEAFWKGEFLLGLAFLQKNQVSLLPALYPYISGARTVLPIYVAGSQDFLAELFPNIEQLLASFDTLAVKFAKSTPFQRAYGFYTGALNAYKQGW